MKLVQQQFFVIEIDSSGIPLPGRLTLCKSSEDARRICAKIARQNGVEDENLIENSILKEKGIPGMFYNNYKAGVWVVSSDNTLDYTNSEPMEKSLIEEVSEVVLEGIEEIMPIPSDVSKAEIEKHLQEKIVYILRKVKEYSLKCFEDNSKYGYYVPDSHYNLLQDRTNREYLLEEIYKKVSKFINRISFNEAAKDFLQNPPKSK
jgi:hypothetical protein